MPAAVAEYQRLPEGRARRFALVDAPQGANNFPPCVGVAGTPAGRGRDRHHGAIFLANHSLFFNFTDPASWLVLALETLFWQITGTIAGTILEPRPQAGRASLGLHVPHTPLTESLVINPFAAEPPFDGAYAKFDQQPNPSLSHVRLRRRPWDPRR